MNGFTVLITVLQIISAIAIVVLVLLQHGKGADMGAAFGSGASGSLFGASGASNFLSRMTAIAAVLFFVATLLLAFVANSGNSTNAGVLEGYQTSAPKPASGSAVAASTANSANAAASGSSSASGSASIPADSKANQIPQ